MTDGDGTAGEGAQFGKYRVERKLGSGAFGSVYEAVLPGPMGFAKRVALKMIPPTLARDPRFVQSMINEARIGGLLNNDHIVDVLEFDQVDGRYYLAMEFVDGPTLAQIIESCALRGTLLPRFATIALAVDVARGLHYAHRLRGPDGESLELIHRDVKPSNIIVNAEGTAKILDFGIAKAASNLFQTTGSEVSKGTPRYMSPEQISCEGTLTHRSDLFSFGVVLFELATGQVLFEAENLPGIWLKITSEDLTGKLIEAEAALPGVRSVLEKALQRDPRRRYPDARTLLGDLRELEQRHPREADMEDVMEILLRDRPPAPAVLGSKDLEVGVVALDEPATEEALIQRPISLPPLDDSGWSIFRDAFAAQPADGGGGTDEPTVTAMEALSDGTTLAVPHLGSTPATIRSASSDGASSPDPLHGARLSSSFRLKQVAWYALTLPMALVLWPVFALIYPEAILSAFGLSTDLPTWIGSAIATILTMGLVIDTWLLARYWGRGKTNLWLHTDAFVLFPALGLAFILYHFFTWSGQTTAHTLSLQSYAAINTSQAEQMMALLQASNAGFLNAVGIDMAIVGLTFVLVLLGYIFVPRPRERVRGRTWRWSLLPAGAALVVLVKVVLFRELTTFQGPVHLGAYLIWGLSAAAMLRLEDSRLPGGVTAWRVLLVGATATLAYVGYHTVLAYIASLQFFGQISPDALPTEARTWIFEQYVHPFLWKGLVVDLVVLVVLFVALLVLVRQHLPLTSSPRGAAIAVTTMLLIGAAIPITIGAMTSAGDQWAALTFTQMVPVSGAGGSFYIDTHPQSLHQGKRGLCASLTEGDRLEVLLEGCEDETVARALAGHGECSDILLAALDSDSHAARCVTGAEARLYCEALGKRLPTPDEWSAAVGLVEAGEHGEWTMDEVHGTPAFDVAIPDGVSGVPGRLDVSQWSDRVGFRCAFSF